MPPGIDVYGGVSSYEAVDPVFVEAAAFMDLLVLGSQGLDRSSQATVVASAPGGVA
ncbi:hypothetical protein ACFY8O_34425 [Streptomyces argenteolus]|uniref:Uncharacterized protein n=1 Tax=Streptomyces argenteolus TaxID=67274 RepID=A0ABW6XGW9_9ACTN